MRGSCGQCRAEAAQPQLCPTLIVQMTLRDGIVRSARLGDVG